MLRKGVQFHDGFGEFTAKDVVFTWEDQKKEDTINGWLSFYQTVIQDIEVVNDHEIVIRMGRNDTNLLNIISEAENGFEIRSKASSDARGVPTFEGRPYAGTGPYQFKERAQGQYIRYERAPFQHWRGPVDFPELEIRFQREASSRLASLQSGEVHFTVLPSDLRVEAEKKGFGTTSSTQAGLRTFLSYFCCSMKDPKDPSAGPLYPEAPLWDVRIRRALNKAINREEMNTAFFEGKGEVMNLPMHHPTRQGWDPAWLQRWQDEYGYDPAAARALLAEAGYGASKPYSITILVQPLPSIGPAEDILEAIGGYWNSIGVQADLAQTDPNEIVTKQRQRQYTNHVRMQSTNSSLFTGIDRLLHHDWWTEQRVRRLRDRQVHPGRCEHFRRDPAKCSLEAGRRAYVQQAHDRAAVLAAGARIVQYQDHEELRIFRQHHRHLDAPLHDQSRLVAHPGSPMHRPRPRLRAGTIVCQSP